MYIKRNKKIHFYELKKQKKHFMVIQIVLYFYHNIPDVNFRTDIIHYGPHLLTKKTDRMCTQKCRKFQNWILFTTNKKREIVLLHQGYLD